jgi:hypothetical protein
VGVGIKDAGTVIGGDGEVVILRVTVCDIVLDNELVLQTLLVRDTVTDVLTVGN